MLARFLQFRFGNIFILKNPSGNSPQTLNLNQAIFWQMDCSAGFAIRRNEKIIQQDSESIENIDGFRNPSNGNKALMSKSIVYIHTPIGGWKRNYTPDGKKIFRVSAKIRNGLRLTFYEFRKRETPKLVFYPIRNGLTIPSLKEHRTNPYNNWPIPASRIMHFNAVSTEETYCDTSIGASRRK